MNKKINQEWEKFGKQDPYFGVLSEANYLTKNLTASRKEIFFQTGELHIKNIIKIIKTYYPNFKMKKAIITTLGIGRINYTIKVSGLRM